MDGGGPRGQSVGDALRSFVPRCVIRVPRVAKKCRGTLHHHPQPPRETVFALFHI